MSAVTSNLIQGSATIYVAAAGTDLPTAGDLAALVAGDLSGWAGVGHTTAPVTLTDTPTLVEATSQQAARTLAVAVSRWETTVETTCREVTLEAIRRAAHGSATSNSVNPSAGTAAEVLSFAIVGPWAGGETVLITVEHGVVDNGINMAFDRENYTELPLSIKVLEGEALPAGYRVSIIG